MGRNLGAAALATSLLLAGSAGPALAFESVLGGGYARDCLDAANEASTYNRLTARAIELCNLALKEQGLTVKDRAATYVNRGILSFSKGDFVAAKQDFDTAIEVEPSLGGAYANQGAALVAMGKFSEGITEIDRGLELGATEPEKAYYNRAIAHEGLDDLTGAYYDFLKASQLNPQWKEPKRQLTRFIVKTKQPSLMN